MRRQTGGQRRAMSNSSREYRQRQELQSLRQQYRDAAQRLFPNVKVAEHANVSETVDKDGAFVEVIVGVSSTDCIANASPADHDGGPDADTGK